MLHQHTRALLTGMLLIAVGCSTAGGPHDAAPAFWLGRAPETAQELALPLAVWSEQLTDPHPMAIHVARIDLQSPDLEVVAMVANDPDGDGPAEASLTEPRKLAEQNRALVAVNANGFAAIPGPDGKREQWREHLPVDILGIAAHAGQRRSGPYEPRANDRCFWIDAEGKPHIGVVADVDEGAREAVNAWWIDLVTDGKILPKPGGDRHPRTAIGLTADRRWLLLVVVDGRQRGYSVGMTAHELAALMLRLGADRAVNLDGGGSSIMLAAEADGELAVVNRPSDGRPRPVPILIGVRRRL